MGIQAKAYACSLTFLPENATKFAEFTYKGYDEKKYLNKFSRFNADCLPDECLRGA